jgi:hypothetical protein
MLQRKTAYYYQCEPTQIVIAVLIFSNFMANVSVGGNAGLFYKN